MTYLDELEGLLRSRGVDGERVRDTVNDLAAFVAESGVEPEEEFGPVTEFADDLTGEEVEAGSGEQTLVWAADSFEAPARLNEKGAEGWEVDRVDRWGRFVSHRDEQPLAWEYRQEVAPGRRERERLLAHIGPEGWEPCGHYFTMAYFKRSRSALVGPSAELSEPPEPNRRRYFLGVPGAVVITFALALMTVGLVSLGLDLWADLPAGEWSGLAGAVVGATVAVAGLWIAFKAAARIRNR